MKTLLPLILLFLLASCSDGSRSPGTLFVTGVAISVSSPTMLYGHNTSTGERLARKMTTEAVTIALSQGTWKFQAISWENSETMSSDPVCGETKIEVGTEKIAVNLAVSKLDCNSQSWFAGVGVFGTPPSMYFSSVQASLCSETSTQAELDSFSCPAGTSNTTGIRLVVREYADVGTSQQVFKSACAPNLAENFYLTAKIPFGALSDFPMLVTLETFDSTNPNCSGEECCLGRSESYHFPHGLSNGGPGFVSRAPVVYNSTKLNLIPKSTDRVRIVAPASATYNSCVSASLNFEDQFGNPRIFQTDETIQLACQGLCTFHTDNSCSGGTVVPSVLIPSGTTSIPIWIKLSDFKAPARAFSLSGTVRSASKTIKSIATFATLDGRFLFGASNVSDISNTQVSVPLLPGLYVYQTREGHRGKFQVNSVSTVSVTGDQFNFDYKTYDSTLSMISSGLSNSITACFSGPCFLDFELNSSAVQSSSNGATDVWWENLSGSLYFNPQATTQVYYLGP